MKKLICTVLALSMILCFASIAYASEQGNAKSTLNLRFNGTTAICSATVSSSGDYIDATMELRYGSTIIGSWDASGNNAIVLSGNASVISGRSYTLVVYGTTNGLSFSTQTVTKVCP